MATHCLWHFLLWLTDKSIGHFICLAFQDILTHYFRLYTKFWLSLLAFLGLCQLDFSHAEKKANQIITLLLLIRELHPSPSIGEDLFW